MNEVDKISCTIKFEIRYAKIRKKLAKHSLDYQFKHYVRFLLINGNKSDSKSEIHMDLLHFNS